MALTDEQLMRLREIAADLARSGSTRELAEFIEHGFDVDAQDPQGNSLLMLAAYHGQVETVSMLIDHRADVDLLNDRGQAALAGALFKGENEVVRVLVEAGADLDAGAPSPRATASFFDRSSLLDAVPHSSLDER